MAWSTPSGPASGVITISATASAASTGTAQIDSWCLTKNGSPVTSNVAASGSIPAETSDGLSTTFNNSTGCWSYPSAQTESYNNLSGGGSFEFDTTAWTNGNYTFQLTVTDTSGLSATSSVLTLAVSNAGPSASLTTADTSDVSGTITVNADAAASSTGTSTIAEVCLTVDGKPVSSDVSDGNLGTFSASTGCWAISGTDQNGNPLSTVSDPFSIKTATLHNGTHELVLTAADSSGRTAESSLSITTNNPGAKISSLRAVPIAPSWSSKSTKITVTVYETNATKVLVKFGTKPNMNSSKNVVIKPSQGSPVLITLSNLPQKTKVYYRITVYGFNGESTSKAKTITTMAIPPKAYVVSTSCSATEYIGTSFFYGAYYYWFYFHIYHWSNGAVTESQEYESFGTRRPC